ncbi:hypothetical protein QFC22_004244 [Naganishia vaughanmartiniae]|uniref:Uncharacterized protein n=1 Tax=Naganishia vaughanmartiniae TaxID=1424756 RepID=A0ACC2X5J6_9TREE|nr:hypothetical protein QFC22_004244 [Naganishia vaughanmartiniae]
MSNVGQYLAFRFEMYLTDAKFRILESLLQKLRMYSADANGRLPGALPQHLMNPGASGALTQGLDVITHRSEAVQRRYIHSIPMPTAAQVHTRAIGSTATNGWQPSAWQPLEGMTFSIRWLIEGLISHDIILPFEATQLVKALEAAFPTRVSGQKNTYEQKIWQSLQERVLCSIYNEERIKDIDAYVRSEYRSRILTRMVMILSVVTAIEKAKYIRQAKRTQEPAHTILIRRVAITPTRILLFPPERETSNSVLRQYADHDSFLRVTFADVNDRLRVRRSGYMQSFECMLTSKLS